MPNYCSNEIVITGPKEDLESLANKFFQPDGTYVFSFDTLLPTPPPLKLVVSGSYTDEAGKTHHNYYYKSRETKTILNPDDVRHNKYSQEEIYISPLTTADIQYFIANYGHTDWYEWRIANWGTKWDMGDCSCNYYNDSININGDTAWNPPDQFLRTVSKQYPTLTFISSYAECGANYYGSTKYENGVAEVLVYEEPEGGFWYADDDDYDYLRLDPEIEQFLEAHGLSTGG